MSLTFTGCTKLDRDLPTGIIDNRVIPGEAWGLRYESKAIVTVSKLPSSCLPHLVEHHCLLALDQSHCYYNRINVPSGLCGFSWISYGDLLIGNHEDFVFWAKLHISTLMTPVVGMPPRHVTSKYVSPHCDEGLLLTKISTRVSTPVYLTMNRGKFTGVRSMRWISFEPSCGGSRQNILPARGPSWISLNGQK